MRFPVTLANVKDFPDIPAEQTRHEINLTAAQTRGGVILWQEVRKASDDKWLRALSSGGKAGSWGHYIVDHPDTNVPISWDLGRFDLVAGYTSKLHAGDERVCNPRFVNVVILDPRLERLAPFAVVDVHFVAGAWSDKHEHDGTLERRRELYGEGRENLRAVVRELIAGGYPVIGGGDHNRRLAMQPKVLGHRLEVAEKVRRVQYHGAPNAIDYLWTINGAGHALDVVDRATLPRQYTDHPARQYGVRLT